MSDIIVENLKRIKSELPKGVTLVAVSKTKPIEDILTTYNAGQRVFGENKVQELQEKVPNLPKDIEWHMIGHLQRNKVKYIAPYISLIHGVDSFKLLKEINKEGKKNNRSINVLLQFHIAQEASKFGFSYPEAEEMINSSEFKELLNINVVGVMGMATNVNNTNQIKKEFESLKNIFIELKEKHFSKNENFKELSMGMSGDYRLAMECGSTMVRIGSSIFGARNYG